MCANCNKGQHESGSSPAEQLAAMTRRAKAAEAACAQLENDSERLAARLYDLEGQPKNYFLIRTPTIWAMTCDPHKVQWARETEGYSVVADGPEKPPCIASKPTPRTGNWLGRWLHKVLESDIIDQGGNG